MTAGSGVGPAAAAGRPRSNLPKAEGLGAEIMARAEALARHSLPGPGVTRMFATAEHAGAAGLIRGWMEEAGLAARIDAAGNVVGRYEGVRPGLPTLMLGSHQDTVRCGGKYDGVLGILTPISCVKVLHAGGERLPFAVEVVAFGDEEGLRFQTAMLGSRAVAGTFDLAVLERTDADGVTIREAMRDFGLDPAALGAVARRPGDLLAYVEVHIEQGPVLEAHGLPVGVVSGIAGCTRLAVAVAGEAGHAGTVPMGRRRDALCAVAEAALEVERCCTGRDGAVGTVGMLALEPGATNVIPGAARFTVDLRAPREAERMALVAEIEAGFEAIGERRMVRFDSRTAYQAAGCECTPWLMDQLAAAVAEEGIAPLRLFSGAGHDAMALAAVTDIGMLFVRCARGLSHNPEEAINAEDAGTGARVLLRFLRAFDRL